LISGGHHGEHKLFIELLTISIASTDTHRSLAASRRFTLNASL
jgi:hypothetical protein